LISQITQRLSNRLACIVSLVAKDSVVMDVGCDHGLVAKYLLENNICKKCISTDISEKSLAKLNITDSRLSKRVGDGLKVLSEADGVDTIIIAGMGGNTICQILNDDTFGADLILAPQSQTKKLRQKLLDKGYQIVVDYCLKDDKYYTLIKAKYIGKIMCLDKKQLEYGINYREDCILKSKLSNQLDALQKIDNIKANQKASQLRQDLDLFL